MTDSRTRILNAALCLFSARGYDGVGVQEVADAAEIGKPTLYHFFGSKRGLLETLLKEQYDPFFVALENAALYSGDLPLTLNRVVKTIVRFFCDAPEFYRLQAALSFAPPESDGAQAVMTFAGRQLMILDRLFLEATRDHGNMRGRNRRYAIAFLGMVNALASAVMHGELAYSDETAFLYLHQFMHGIYS